MTDSAPILQFATAEDTLQSCNRRLVDVVDALLSQGIAIRGELWLTVADVDLVFLGLDLLLANPDRLQRTVPDAT
ncbi:gas vesicle protein GvpJ [Cereibacter johrii]|uniref:gas vesicle protein GvpJ n=1 Tax=Cereibacter johrii TaxID=445629 RepID=UPI002B25D9C4|nr:gas vesicle protein GvpJ [Cereibacter johrii]MEA5163039.1 gas vesicle protein GvpJ [Cereibacter johrii]